MVTCPVCGAESENTYKCSECGKLFDGDDGAGDQPTTVGRGS